MVERKPRQVLPGFIPFQLVTLVSSPPPGERWGHEIKFDGYRLQIRVEGGRVTIWTRNGLNWTDKFPELVAVAQRLPNCILDGELCVVDAEGRPDFSALRAALGPGRTDPLVYFAFDMLFEGTDDLRPYALPTRKVRLQAALAAADASGKLAYVEMFTGDAAALFRQACRHRLEGIVSKRLDVGYRSGRTGLWVKSKCRPGQEVVIGGWRTEHGTRFRSLMAGVYEPDGRLRYAGTINTGYSAAVVADLEPRLRALEVAASPYSAGEPPRKTRDVHWVRPELVAQVEFAEWTAAGKLRQASFKGLREDRLPHEVQQSALG